MENIPTLPQQGLQVFRDISSRDIDSAYAVRDRESLVYRYGVGYAVAGVEHDTRCAAGGVEGEDGLDGCEEGGDIEGFEEDLGGRVAV